MNFSVDIAGIAALIGVVIALYKVFRMGGAEVAGADAEAAKAYSEAANSSAERAEKAERRCAERDTKIEELNARLDVLEKSTARKDRYIEYLLAGIERLIHQMQAHEMTPTWKPEPMDKIV